MCCGLDATSGSLQRTIRRDLLVRSTEVGWMIERGAADATSGFLRGQIRIESLTEFIVNFWAEDFGLNPHAKKLTDW